MKKLTNFNLLINKFQSLYFILKEVFIKNDKVRFQYMYCCFLDCCFSQLRFQVKVNSFSFRSVTVSCQLHLIIVKAKGIQGSWQSPATQVSSKWDSEGRHVLLLRNEVWGGSTVASRRLCKGDNSKFWTCVKTGLLLPVLKFQLPPKILNMLL